MAQDASTSKTTNAIPQQRPEKSEPAANRLPRADSSGSVAPLPFDRLLSVAVLTPGQASLVAVQLLDAAHRSGTGDGTYRAGVRLGAVALTSSGEVEVAPSQPDEGAHVTELLGQLVQNARRLPAHPRPEHLLLLHRLEEVAGGPLLEPAAEARKLEATLADTLGSSYRKRLAGQLAVLVDAFAHVAPSVPATADAAPGPMLMGTTLARQRAALATAGSSRPESHRAAPARVAPPHRPHGSRNLIHRRRRGWRVALAILVVAAVLAGGGYLLVRGSGDGILGLFGRGSPPVAQHTTAPGHPSKQPAKQPRSHRQGTRAVPALAGRHAGPVTGVKVQKTGSCKPGALCPVKVTVHLRPASTARSVGWKVGAARLCKRGIRWSPAPTVTAQPGWTTVFANSSVRVPKGRSLALVALTTTPARAQSGPVPVTGSSLHC